MRRVAIGGVAAVGVLAACMTASDRRPVAHAQTADPLPAGIAAAAAGRNDEAIRLLAEAEKRYPTVADLAVYFGARAKAASGNDAVALADVDRLLERHPDSVWTGPARLLAGRVRRQTGDLTGARAWLAAAREALVPGRDRWALATAMLAEVQHELGEDAEALELATLARQSQPRGLAARRARRLTERIRIDAPSLVESPEAHALEAELRLREGDVDGARAEAGATIAGSPDAAVRARAVWTRAQAEHALGLAAPAEATCLALAASGPPAAGARALAAAATWRWNADDDAGALRLFRDLTERFPASPQAAEALYGIARIHQEAGRYAEAGAAYVAMSTEFPSAPTAAEARWRAGWVHYLAGDWSGAATWFGSVAAHAGKRGRVAAEYWEARALERQGSPEAAARIAHVADHHARTYYGALAQARLGVVDRPVTAEGISAPRATFPADLEGPHAERARLLTSLRLGRFARLELDAVRALGPDRRLLDAYSAIGAPGPAIRLATDLWGERGLRRYLYPLGFWEPVRSGATASGTDPLLVEAVIRQESLFEPDAVSPADAHGLMQLLPRTARELAAAAGRPAPDRGTLHEPAVNVALGSLLLRRLLDRYGGSRVKALAAYNAGEEAVAKWEQRYGGRPEDEFVELISYRETRDYVKAVIRNYQVYRARYAGRPTASGEPPSASATSAGSPPNAPFDMTTMTSPRFAVSTR